MDRFQYLSTSRAVYRLEFASERCVIVEKITYDDYRGWEHRDHLGILFLGLFGNNYNRLKFRRSDDAMTTVVGSNQWRVPRRIKLATPGVVQFDDMRPIMEWYEQEVA